MIHCIDQSKTFTLLLKSKILDFETLSRVHVYRIEHVSYWQGPYRIRIDTVDDRIVPALINSSQDNGRIPFGLPTKGRTDGRTDIHK